MTAKRFTGRHMAAILVAFFGVIVAVNLLMATLATRTFGGVVVENSYVASQKFNGWLAEARRQKSLGWTVEATLADDRRVTLLVSEVGATATATAKHPLGRAPDVALRFTRKGRLLVSDRPLPEGRWHVTVAVRSGGQEVRSIETLS